MKIDMPLNEENTTNPVVEFLEKVMHYYYSHVHCDWFIKPIVVETFFK